MDSDFLTDLQKFESGGRNIPNVTQGTSSGQAQGYNQITTGTWTEFAPQVGVDLSRFPTALSAPMDVQNKVAGVIPLERWDPKTLAYLKAKGYALKPNLPLNDNIALNGGGPSAAANMAVLNGPVNEDAFNKWAGGTAAPTSSAPPKNAVAPTPFTPLTAPVDESAFNKWVGAGAAQTAAAQPARPVTTAGSAPPFQSNPNAVLNAPSNVVDPGEPVGQQVGTAARNALSYLGPQVAGIPGAIASDYRGATAMNALGNQELNSGVRAAFPSFPSTDPSTWGAGGIVHALGGMAGQITSPITGAVRQLIEDPVTQATGNPEIGSRAGFVANSLATPFAARALGAVPNALAGGAMGALDPETANLAQLAKQKYGIPLTAPQLSDNAGLKYASSALDRLPLSGAGDIAGAQQSAFNRAVSHTIGEDADKITPNVMMAAKDRIGAMFDNVAQNTTIHVDDKFQNDLQETLINASKELPEGEVKPLYNLLDNITQKINQDGTIDGAAYQALTRKWTPLARAIDSNNPNIAHFSGQIRNALDGALERSAPPEMQDQLTTARSQYRNLMTIKPLAAKADTGDVSPALLRGAVNSNTGNGLAFGQGGDLGELARIGQRFLKEPGSSGTTERAIGVLAAARAGAVASSIPSALAAVGSHYGVLGALSPLQMAATASTVPATLFAGRGIGSALRSQWLSNALINRSLAPAAPVNGLSAPAAVMGGSAGLLNKPVNALGAPNQ